MLYERITSMVRFIVLQNKYAQTKQYYFTQYLNRFPAIYYDIFLSCIFSDKRL